MNQLVRDICLLIRIDGCKKGTRPESGHCVPAKGKLKQGEKAMAPRKGTPITEGGDNVLNELNPTSGVFVGYTPEARVKAKLGKNITTLAHTMGKRPDDLVKVYRGSGFQESINNGDFVTTNKQLAEDYAGTGKVLSQIVRYGDILDDKNEPLGEEYILRKGAFEEIEKTVH